MVKTVNEEVLDAVIRHQIYIQRYSGYVRNRMTAILNASEEELARRIRDALRDSAGLTTAREWQRLQALLAALDGIRMDSWVDAKKLLIDQMTELAYQEPITLNGLYTTPVPVQISTVIPPADVLRTIALSRPFEGRLLKDWADNMAQEDIRRIHGAIQAGMIAGEDHVTIAQRVVGKSTLMGADGVTEITRRQVNTIVRTAVQHVANGARDAYFDENKDLFTLEQFVATLDSRTTPICRALDGHRYDVGKGPRPPLHFNCRSLRVAVFDGAFLGDRPANPTTERLLAQEYARINGHEGVKNRSSLPYGTKGDFDKWKRGQIRQMVGPVPATSTYQGWLMGQSNAFQEEVLGKVKAQLFRDGGLKLDQFVDMNSQREFTLNELASKHAQAFRAAGLDPKGF
jgi:SPP1 gp7 family putative phage head morphogenesis protein